MPTRVWTGHELAAAVESQTPRAVARATEVACYLDPNRLVEAMINLRDGADTDFVALSNLCGTDHWDHLEVVYHLHSYVKNQRCTVKVEVPDRDKAAVPSMVPVWFGAWMQECEAYDMFGINFEDHPNLYRILLWDGYPGWPLRKDFTSLPGGLQPGLGEFAGVSPRPAPPVREVAE
jgi:NADH-quinone oxidoreductase subunit C